MMLFFLHSAFEPHMVPLENGLGNPKALRNELLPAKGLSEPQVAWGYMALRHIYIYMDFQYDHSGFSLSTVWYNWHIFYGP